MALYTVATPIGNTQDITRRALDVLSSVPLILAEDTRKTRQLLERYQDRTFTKRIERLDDHVRGERLTRLADELETTDAALVSCAGTPGVSDPGESIVAACVDRRIRVIPIPGPSALAAITSVADFAVEPLVFYGFLPTKKGRQSELKRLKESAGKHGLASAVFYESPFRIRRLLTELADLFGPQTRIVVGRELTKKFEELWYGTLGEAIEHFVKPRGEFTLLIHLFER